MQMSDRSIEAGKVGLPHTAPFRLPVSSSAHIVACANAVTAVVPHDAANPALSGCEVHFDGFAIESPYNMRQLEALINRALS